MPEDGEIFKGNTVAMGRYKRYWFYLLLTSCGCALLNYIFKTRLCCSCRIK